MAKITVSSKEEIRNIFKSWNSTEMKERLKAHPESVVCYTTHRREEWGTPFAIYDSLKAAREDLGDAKYGVTLLRNWFV